MANPPLKETEIDLELETTDSPVEGSLRYVNGALKGRDDYGLYDLRLGGGGYLTITASSDNPSVTSGSWLFIGGVSTHPLNSPPTMPFDGTIVAVSAGVDVNSPPGAAWAIDIVVNGVLKTTIQEPSGTLTELYNDGLSIDVSAGDRVSVRSRLSGGNPPLDKPIVSLVLRLRR